MRNISVSSRRMACRAFSLLTLSTMLAWTGCQEPPPPVSGHETGQDQQEDVQPKSTAAAETQFLFDGQSFTHWEIARFGGSSDVRIEHQAIVADAGYPLVGIRWVGPELPKENYTLCLQAQKIEGTDFFCCVTFPADGDYCSLVVGGWGGPVTGISCVDGADAADNATRSLKKYEPGVWYNLRIDVTAERLVVHLDDAIIVDLDLDEVQLSLRNDVEATRPLALCAFETSAAWRNIRLIQPALAPDAAIPEFEPLTSHE